MTILRFPEGFLWGAATASYQIEGSPLADGAGESIWHRFSHEQGRIENGDTGDIACDHYRRWQEDIALMKEIGLTAYRFSSAWPRVLPEGRGTVNQAGLDFYDRLVDGLLEAGIEPMLTLYHWDLPQKLEDQGGWPEPSTAEAYADYAGLMFETFGGRVKRWITFNEPWVFTWIAYALGIHAPGRNEPEAAMKAAHTVLRAHGMAVERLRAADTEAEVGITLSVQAHVPLTASDGDLRAARRSEAFHNLWFTEPIMKGHYPAELVEEFGEGLPELSPADIETITRPIDFIGVNYYTRNLVAAEEGGFLGARILHPPGRYTEMAWEVYPAGLYKVLKEFHERYGLPLYVTENGAAFPSPSGESEAEDAAGLEDWERLAYLQSHFSAAHRALSEGVDLRGYMVWTLMDNFEWSFGFSKRFGLMHCNHETGERRLRKSAQWYARVIEDNGI